MMQQRSNAALTKRRRSSHSQDVLCVTFDDYEGSLATLVNAARESIRGFQADSIGVLTPCSPGADLGTAASGPNAQEHCICYFDASSCMKRPCAERPAATCLRSFSSTP